MSFESLLDKLISETIEEHQTPIRLLNEIDDETYDYIVDAAEDLKPGTMNSYFGGQQRVVIPLNASDNEEIQKFYDEVVIPLASKGLRVDLKDGVAVKEVETQRGKQERKIKLGKVIGKQLPAATQEWWNKVQAKFLGNPEVLDNKYSIVISQNPVDVARMSDHREIQSCHSPGSDYFQCALADARRAGAIAYLIDSDDAPYIESHLNDPEVFADRDRGTEGVTPLARVRLRRFDHVEPDSGFIDAFLVPESRIYGRSVPGFLNTVLAWARDEQDDHPFFEKKLDPRNIYHRGGTYSDSAFSSMFNNLLGLENIELNDDLEMYPHSMPMINDTTDERYVDHVSGEGQQRQMDHGEEMMSDLNYEYFNHDDVNLDYDLEWDEWGESVVVESWKVTIEFDLPVQAILNSEFVKNNESVNVDPESPWTIQQDELNHNSVWGHIESLVEEAYENSDHYNEYLEQPSYDAQAELIRFGAEGKLIYRIRLLWEGGGEPIPVFDENIAKEIYNLHNEYDELKIEIVEKLIEEEVYAPTKYQKLRKSIEFDEEEYMNRLDGELLGHFRIEFQSGHLVAYSDEKLDNYPAPGIRKIGKFPEWVKSNESPPLAHIMGFDENNFSGMATTIAYSPKRIIGMLLNPMWGDKVIAHLENDLVDASVAAHNQLALAFDASDRDAEEDKEWGERKDALEVLKSIKVYFSADVIYIGGTSPYHGRSPSRRGTGGLYFKFNETDNEYTIKGLVQFLKYFDEHYDVVQAAIQKVWDDFVDSYNENAPIAQEEGVPKSKSSVQMMDPIKGKIETETKHFLKQMIQEVIEEELKIDANPDRNIIINAIDDPNYLVSFTEVPKVGINPSTRYNTPAGIYGWHWTKDIIDRASKNKLFGSKRKYAQLLKIKDGAKVLWLADDAKTGQIPTLDQAADMLFNQYPSLGEPAHRFLEHVSQKWAYEEPFIDWLKENYKKHARTSDRNHGGGSATEDLYDFTLAAARMYADEWLDDSSKRTIVANKMLRLLGFDAVMDTYGKGIIHKNEAQQGFFTHKGGLDHVTTIDNNIYSLPATAAMSILLSPDAPREAIEKALTAVLDAGHDIKSDPTGGAKFDMHDRLDILDYATRRLWRGKPNAAKLNGSDLTRIHNFVSDLLRSRGGGDTTYSLVGDTILNNILSHPEVPDEIYEAGIQKMMDSDDPDPLTMMDIINNPAKTSPEFLQAAADGVVSKSPNVRITALKNPKTPVETLVKYIRDYPKHFKDSRKYRLAMAAMTNPSVPRGELLDLLYDEDGNIIYNNDVMRDIVTNTNLPPEAMSDILDALLDKEKAREKDVFVSDVLESFIMSPNVPEDLVIRIFKEWEEMDGEYSWKNAAGDMIKRALLRNYQGDKPKKVGPQLLDYLRQLFTDIRLDPEYEIERQQGDYIDKVLEDQGAYKENEYQEPDEAQKQDQEAAEWNKNLLGKNESKDFGSLMRGLIGEQIKIAIGEKKEDSDEVAKVVLQDGRRVLLIKRSDYSDRFPLQWDLPGGHAHVGEEKEKGLEREVKEETGLCIEDVNELYSVGSQTFYIADLPAANIKLSHEHTEHKMVDIDDIAGHEDLSAKYKDAILTAMEDAPLAENKIISEMFVKGDPEGKNIVAYRQNIWRMGDLAGEDIRKEIKDVLGYGGNWDWGYDDLKDELEGDGRMDVLMGTVVEGGKTLHIDQVGSFRLDPKSSILVKKVVKELGIRKVVYPTDYNWGDEDEVPFYGVKGKIADIMYHGTTSNYLENILKFGLVPGKSETNYESISHPDAVFFSSRMEEALHHAVHTASKVGGDPIIVNLKVPDPALLIPDYDVDMGVGDTGCYDYICQTLRDKQAGGLDIDSFSLSREVGVYGYKGRVPASAIFEYDILMNAEETMNTSEMYDARVGEFMQATPEEAATYIETKNEFGYGSFEYPEMDEEDEE